MRSASTPTFTAMALDIQHEDDGKRGAHYVPGADGTRAAVMTYVRAGATRIIVDHTHVDDSLRGQGVGRALLDATADMARAEGIKVTATCPFAKAQLEKYAEAYGDVT